MGSSREAEITDSMAASSSLLLLLLLLLLLVEMVSKFTCDDWLPYIGHCEYSPLRASFDAIIGSFGFIKSRSGSSPAVPVFIPDFTGELSVI